MEIDSSDTLGGGGGESSSRMSPLLCGETIDDTVAMMSPPDSPRKETLTADSPASGSESPPGMTAEGQQPETDSPSDTAESTSSQPLLITFGPTEPPNWNQQKRDEPIGFSPFARRVMPSGVGAGLMNLGLTCFMNSVLQCLTHTVPLIRSLQSWDHASPCDRFREDFCLLCVLREHIIDSLDSSGGIISPMKFADNLNQISSYFQKHQQEDAHEFQQALLDKLERCCLDQKKEGKSLPRKNIVDEVFGGRLISKLKCCNCGHSSCTYEPLVDLSLEIEHVETIGAALESFTSIETMSDPESKFRCENCKEYVAVEKQLLVENEPTIAALHLKRFKTNGFFVDKIDKHVPFPLGLDLQPFTNGCESDVELNYQLYAIVVHIGISPTWGHYFSFVQSSPGVWHKFDDSKVVRVSEEFVLSQDAYILFYAKQGTPWFSSVMEEFKPTKPNIILETSPKSVLDKLDCPQSPNPAFPSMKNSACHATVDNAMDIPNPTSARETQVVEDGSEEITDDTGFVDNLFVNETQSIAGGALDGDRCNNGQEEIEMDEKFHPLTPPESPSPPESPRSIQDKRPSEASSNKRPTHQRKSDRSSCRKQLLSKSLEDPKKKEALRYMKGMPSSRATQFFNAMHMLGPRTPASSKKKSVGNNKRRIGAASLCERTSPSSSRQRSRSGQQPVLPPPVL